MTTATQMFLLRALTIALAGALLLTDRLVPQELWVLVAGLAGLSVPRPGDTSPTQLARVLEANDPTARPSSAPADDA